MIDQRPRTASLIDGTWDAARSLWIVPLPGKTIEARSPSEAQRMTDQYIGTHQPIRFTDGPRMLKLAPDLELPLDAVTQATAILARRGAGKTHTASVLVEEVVTARMPVVVLDPTGAWWGLRSSASGTEPGLPVVILGGEHGDVPLERADGRKVADVVIAHPGAYVIDLSGFESRAAELQFVADFLERLYRAKVRHREPLLVVVDEADGYAPQKPGGEQLRTLGALEAIVRRGRIRGLGVLLISQRSAVLNKNVLTQVELLIAMQTTGPQDRSAIDDWIKDNGSADERAQVLGSLASLERGEAWVWSPSWLRILQRVKIRARTTFDSSRTPEAGGEAVTPRAYAQVDVGSLGGWITSAVDEAKANDPSELRRRISQLERELADRPAPEVRVEHVEVPVLNGEVERLEAVLTRLEQIGVTIQEAGNQISMAALDLSSAFSRVQQRPVVAPPPQQLVSPMSAVAAKIEAAALPDGEIKLGKAELALLGVLAQFPYGLTKVRLSLLSGYSATSSSFANALGKLRSAGLVARGADPIIATSLGLHWENLPPPLSRAEQLAAIRSRLDKAQTAFFDAIEAAHPTVLTKEELSVQTGYSVTSSSFANALGRLRSLDLVEGLALHPDLAD